MKVAKGWLGSTVPATPTPQGVDKLLLPTPLAQIAVGAQEGVRQKVCQELSGVQVSSRYLTP